MFFGVFARCERGIQALHQCQVQADVWIPLPYEIASAYVRTLMLHARKLSTSKVLLNEALEKDPNAKKKGTQKLRGDVESLMVAVRHFVLCKKTGQLATQEWLSKHIQVSPEGVPSVKNPKCKAQIMSLGFTLAGTDVSLSLKLGADMAEMRVRCFHYETGKPNHKLSVFLDGYEHMVENFDDVDEDDEESQESSDSEIYDQHGLEG